MNGVVYCSGGEFAGSPARPPKAFQHLLGGDANDIPRPDVGHPSFGEREPLPGSPFLGRLQSAQEMMGEFGPIGQWQTGCRRLQFLE